MIELVEAKFIGLDGSIGYRHGQTYKIMVETSDNSPRLMVRLADNSGRCPYDNIFAFLANWRITDAKFDYVVDEAKDITPVTPEEFVGGGTYVDSKGKEHNVTELTEPHLLNIARKNWRSGRPHAAIDAEMKRRDLNIKEYLTKEDLE